MTSEAKYDCPLCRAGAIISKDGSPYHVISTWEGHERELELCRAKLAPTLPKPECATEMPMKDCGLTINTGRDGTWLHFRASSGLYASINVDVMAEARGNITATALKDWCKDRREQADAIKATQS